MTEERRKTPRVMVRVLVDFESTDTYLYDYSNNLSEGGIYIETNEPLNVGETLTLRFTLPNVDRVFEAEGEVTWTFLPENEAEKNPDGLGKGMGICFKDMDETDHEMVKDYISKLETHPT